VRSAIATRRLGAAAFVAFWMFAAAAARAEPYVAVEYGLKCATCHVNPTGGGKRNLFGMTVARTQIARRTILSDADALGWNSSVTDWFGIGGDVRGGYLKVDPPGPGNESDFDLTKATVYAEFRAVRNLLTFYFDEKVAPDNTEHREAYLLATPKNGRYTVKAGQFFLPYGLRIQDDSAFVRQRSGINFDKPDDGIEIGLELPKWSAQVASTNGTSGSGSEPGKDQLSLSAVYVMPRWRVGTSYNLNEDPLGDREMQAVFAGFRTGPIAWLTELDFITDKNPGGRSNDIYATLLEGNWRINKGNNLKVTYEFLDPSDGSSEDEQERYSIVWEHSPVQLLQARVGARFYNGVPELPSTNRNEVFAELHVFF
jgi:hypothetical protein